MSLSARVYFIGHPSRQAKAGYAERETAIREHMTRSRLERLAGKLEQVPPPIAPAMSVGEAQREAERLCTCCAASTFSTVSTITRRR